ncbi:MAG: purine-nucleoside phosphorylase [Rhodothermaceae bacterium]|nr:purine-nucleoside phosphorylase [Rhodothermaceae bacterium]MXW31649.1 purine-nucleoside phosphorylase [Rhodothermaceae bacterium]MYC04641.1 purine-nucleoside phosphorylase [Rhodothermaceae bacterium]MYE62921.1 purine-nucleoside phosphorylase [Rhodothermaceae bacterium]MYI18146.1 purine-nucleoside phosphorylase [Rhodothermaceae bacterium]
MSRVKTARNLLSKRLGEVQPSVAIILGSGCGLELDQVHWSLTASNIPGFVAPSVAGHSGRVTSGVFTNHEVLLMQGRVHYYEGVSTDRVTFQVRLIHELGIKNIILISAAGGIRATLNPGEIMLVEGHICAQPLTATYRGRSVYDALWRERVIAACTGLTVSSGVYVWTIGPSYETPSEIVAFERRGGDAVGMSLVPEAMEASALDMHVLGATIITNSAAGLHEQELNHEDVLRSAEAARANLADVIARALMQAPQPYRT